MDGDSENEGGIEPENPKISFGSIPRAKVQRLVENLNKALVDLAKVIESEDLNVDDLLEQSRYIARLARRVQRKLIGPRPMPEPDAEMRDRPMRSPPGAGGPGGMRRGPPRGRSGPPRRFGGGGGGGGGYRSDRGGGGGGGGYRGDRGGGGGGYRSDRSGGGGYRDDRGGGYRGR